MAEHTEPRFRFDASTGQLWRNDQPVQLTKKAFQLLQFFVENPNRILSQDDIFDHLWPETIVSESLVREYVHDIRVALGETSNSPKFIETVRGRGYRYLGGIEKYVGTTSFNSGPPRIVVLPWQQYVDAGSIELLGRGFSSELVTLLAGNRDLAVIAKSSASTLSGEDDPIGKARQILRADYAIEGELISRGDSLLLSVNAVNTETETIIWSDSCTIPQSKLASFESDFVPSVAIALGARSGPILLDATYRAKRRLPTHLSAFEQYLLGVDHYESLASTGIAKAQTHLEQAVKQDPSHAQSWLQLSYVFDNLIYHGPVEQAEQFSERRIEAIDEAFEFDPLDGRILIEYADYLYEKGDFEGSSQGYLKAYELNRGVADVQKIVCKYLAGVVCDENLARKSLRIAHDLNPVGDNSLKLNELRTLYILGDLDAGISVGNACPDTPLRTIFLALCYLESNQKDIARDMVQTEIKRSPDFEPTRFESHHYVRNPKIQTRFFQGLKQLSAYLQ